MYWPVVFHECNSVFHICNEMLHRKWKRKYIFPQTVFNNDFDNYEDGHIYRTFIHLMRPPLWSSG
jgi:hypothetical protein